MTRCRDVIPTRRSYWSTCDKQLSARGLVHAPSLTSSQFCTPLSYLLADSRHSRGPLSFPVRRLNPKRCLANTHGRSDSSRVRAPKRPSSNRSTFRLTRVNRGPVCPQPFDRVINKRHKSQLPHPLLRLVAQASNAHSRSAAAVGLSTSNIHWPANECQLGLRDSGVHIRTDRIVAGRWAGRYQAPRYPYVQAEPGE